MDVERVCRGSLLAAGVVFVGITGVLRVASSSTGMEAWERAHGEGESEDCVNTGKGGKGETWSPWALFLPVACHAIAPSVGDGLAFKRPDAQMHANPIQLGPTPRLCEIPEIGTVSANTHSIGSQRTVPGLLGPLIWG